MPPGSDDLLVSNDLSELARITAWLDAWAGRHRVPAQILERLHVCSTEAVTNVIMHGYLDRAPHQICLTLANRGTGFALEIEDDASAFDPCGQGEPQPATDLENARIGGWGLSLMRRFSDEMHYRRADARNVLTLVFRIRG